MVMPAACSMSCSPLFFKKDEYGFIALRLLHIGLKALFGLRYCRNVIQFLRKLWSRFIVNWQITCYILLVFILSLMPTFTFSFLRCWGLNLLLHNFLVRVLWIRLLILLLIDIISGPLLSWLPFLFYIFDLLLSSVTILLLMLNYFSNCFIFRELCRYVCWDGN